MNDDTLRDEINKRFTLNWLIQGAAQHAGMTFHHIVRDELDAIDPELVPLYDQYALINLLQYWHIDGALLLGRPTRFWKRAASDPKHPFFGHPVLSRHGGMLALAARDRGRARCKEKGFWLLRFFFPFQVVRVVGRLKAKEAGHSQELIRLAKKAVDMVWGIPQDRLEGELTKNVAFGKLSSPRTAGGRNFRSCAVGYGGVIRRGKSLVVVGKGTNWQLVAKELVKGTAELICLHGLNRLSDEMYQQVIAAADGVDYEAWMLQTGGELWRRVLAVLPSGRPLAEILMHLARLPARSLETLMLAVIEQPDLARELLAGLGATDEESSFEFGGLDDSSWDGR
ncbi:MAG TPA: hypothetical protein VGZ47_19395 [Gemmataceae bacterium]|jgi:hypothetical protein|nr:hypothetical protein [Gemmataceae bacterium]